MDEVQKQKLLSVAKNAAIRSYEWPQRGKPPIGYYKGMAFSFARLYCKLKLNDPIATDIAKADTAQPAKDALSHYYSQFTALGVTNNISGVDTLRHVFDLLLGLGMRESSGKFCEGRDMAANNIQGQTCEAGLFQVSYNLQSATPHLAGLVSQYAGRNDFVEIFKEGVNCSAASLKNWGTGPGVDFQKLTKACPAFAVEFAAIGLRHQRSHWGPINNHSAELRSDSDKFFRQVQTFVDDEAIVTV